MSTHGVGIGIDSTQDDRESSQANTVEKGLATHRRLTEDEKLTTEEPDVVRKAPTCKGPENATIFATIETELLRNVVMVVDAIKQRSKVNDGAPLPLDRVKSFGKIIQGGGERARGTHVQDDGGGPDLQLRLAEAERDGGSEMWDLLDSRRALRRA
ncbi:hypothetical protein PAXINDRAFT_19640 [Paxillus involutus ATCC 200175]|uniref:Uncharacterized protein n=1 Tax=Paxillus involutus ATCC 200175 TaxID=664439 RepID=A0A0C9TGT1_PAXIN|nr:hypothetical protein PAXINDRAFT_19640 [Paxillus involutus ATCC 200175]